MTPPPPRPVHETGAAWHPNDYKPATRAYLHVIGDIGITRNLVVTPSGTCALRDAELTIDDHSAGLELDCVDVHCDDEHHGNELIFAYDACEPCSML